MPKATVMPSLPPSPVPRHSARRSGGTATAGPPIPRPAAPTVTVQPSLCSSFNAGPNSQPAGQSTAALPTGAARRPAAEISVVAAASDQDLIAEGAHDIGIEVRAAGPTGHRFARPIGSLRNLECVGAEQDETEAAPLRGVVGRAGSTSLFDLDRWAPSDDAGRLVEHFWSVSWDLRGQQPLGNTVITFPSLHITANGAVTAHATGFRCPTPWCTGWSSGFSAPRSASAARWRAAPFPPGGFTARFGRDAAALSRTRRTRR